MSLRLEPSQQDIQGIQLSTVGDEALLAWGEGKGVGWELYLTETTKSHTAKLYAAKITPTSVTVTVRAGKCPRASMESPVKSSPGV